MALLVSLYKKTGANTWLEIRGMGVAANSFDFAGLNTTQIPIGANAIKVTATDEAGMSESSIVVFDNGNTTRRFNNFKVDDKVAENTGLMSLTSVSPWIMINDTLPRIHAYMDATPIQSYSEIANVNINCIQSVRLFLAWKPYVDASTTKATIDPLSTSQGSQASANGQCFWDITNNITLLSEANETIEFFKDIISGPTTELQGGRIYTIGAKWMDSTGTYHPYVASDERSFVLDTNPPNVMINTPTNGFIYNANVVSVSGTCTDPVVG